MFNQLVAFLEVEEVGVVRSRPLSVEQAEAISRYVLALAHPVRIRLVYALDEHGELSAGEVADELAVTKFDASHHLRILLGEEIVHWRREGRRRIYRLSSWSDPVALLDRLVEDVERSIERRLLDE